MRRLIFAPIALLMLTPSVVASGELDAGVLVVRVQDNHGEDCAHDIASFCFASVTNASNPGDAEVDATQRVQYVGIATDVPFTPHTEKNISGDDMHVSYPFIRQARETYDTIPQDRPYRDSAGLIFNETGVGVYYYGPSPGNATGEWRNGSLGQKWSHNDDDEKGGVGYEQAGPFNTECCGDTDQSTTSDRTVCFASAATCGSYQTYAGESTRQSLTPQVDFGFKWEEVQVATDPAALSGSQQMRREDTLGTDPLRREHQGPMVGPRAPRQLSAGVPVVTIPNDDANAPAKAAPILAAGPTASALATFASGAAQDSGTLRLIAAAATAVIVLLAIAGFLLYSRFNKPEEVLASPVRAKILELVKAKPGVPLMELARDLGLPRMTARFHVVHLQKVNLVQTVLMDRSLCVFPYGAAPAEMKLSGRVQRRLFGILRASEQGLTRAELRAATLDMPKASRDEGIRKLIQKGVIYEAPDAKRGGVLRLT